MLQSSPQTSFPSTMKDAIRTRSEKRRNHFEYLDKMEETLNKNIQENVFPHWRQHGSLKGKLL
jgi:antitoxin component of MazEF toxin-antitoxin module